MLAEMINHENALESFAVSVWREAETCTDNAGWSRAYERLWAVQMYLSWLRLYPVANIASDLKAIAAMHSGKAPAITASQPSKGESSFHHAHIQRLNV
ncbi:MAG: hypothetical protein Q8L39_07115 [Burkholderiales bacterium]|nr:hypothetical protein [Burkholderiales bacterium]